MKFRNTVLALVLFATCLLAYADWRAEVLLRSQLSDSLGSVTLEKFRSDRMADRLGERMLIAEGRVHLLTGLLEDEIAANRSSWTWGTRPSPRDEARYRLLRAEIAQRGTSEVTLGK